MSLGLGEFAAKEEQLLVEGLRVVCGACVEIRHAVSHTRPRETEGENAYGETQLNVDVMADDLLRQAVESRNRVVVEAPRADETVRRTRSIFARYASEELDGIRNVKESEPRPDAGGCCDPAGRYLVCWDPLDGSSIIGANWTVGTFVAILDNAWQEGEPMRPYLRATIVATYGPRMDLLITLASSMQTIRCNSELRGRVLAPIPPAPLRYFAPGNLRVARNIPAYRRLVDGWIDEGLTLRYCGGLVPDIGHIIHKANGVYISPADEAHPAKLRMLFELAPIALLMESLGYKAVSLQLKKPILDVPVDSSEQRSDFLTGPAAIVDDVLSQWP